MTTQTVITIDHVRAVGLCVNGTRTLVCASRSGFPRLPARWL